MTLFDCADVVKCIHLALDEDKKRCLFETGAMFGVTSGLLRCFVYRSSVDPVSSSDFPSPTHSAPRGYHEEHTRWEYAHTEEEMCVQDLIVGSLISCLLTFFSMWMSWFFFMSVRVLGQRACRSLFSHCCVQWHNVLCCFHQSAKAPSLQIAYVHTNAQLPTY